MLRLSPTQYRSALVWSIMPRYDEKSEVFIVRLWVEPRELTGAPPIWRGELEHIASHQRAFFQELNKLLELLQPYLASLLADQSKP